MRQDSSVRLFLEVRGVCDPCHVHIVFNGMPQTGASIDGRSKCTRGNWVTKLAKGVLCSRVKRETSRKKENPSKVDRTYCAFVRLLATAIFHKIWRFPCAILRLTAVINRTFLLPIVERFHRRISYRCFCFRCMWQTGDPYEAACDGCEAFCDGCSFEDPLLVPICTEELDHTVSAGGTVTLDQLKIEAGYWRATESSADILACFHADACLGGVTGSAGYCREGYEGPCEYHNRGELCIWCTSGCSSGHGQGVFRWLKGVSSFGSTKGLATCRDVT